MSVPDGAFTSKSRRTTASSCARLFITDRSSSGTKLEGNTIRSWPFTTNGCMRHILLGARHLMGPEWGCGQALTGQVRSLSVLAVPSYMCRPPLTPQNWPVMYAGAAAARKWTTRAISSGWHSRPTVIVDLILSSTFSGDVLQHLGRDEAGCHRVHRDADAVLLEPARPGEDESGLLGEGLGQSEHARLGRGVVSLTNVPGLADDRGDEDDATGAAFNHVFQRRLSHVERAGQVHGNDLVPLLHRHLHRHLVHGDTGIVDQDVDPPVLVEHLLDHPAAVVWVGHVALVDCRAPGPVEVTLELFDELLCPFPVPAVPGGNRGALAGQAPADSGADPPGPSGDQCDSPRELLADHSGGWFNNGRADVLHEVPSRWMFMR